MKETVQKELETLGYPFTQEAYDEVCKVLHKIEGAKLLIESQQEIMKLKHRLYEVENEYKAFQQKYNEFAHYHNELILGKELLITQLQTQLLAKKV